MKYQIAVITINNNTNNILMLLKIPTAQIPEMLTTHVAYHRIDCMLYSIFITKSVSLSNMYKKFHLYYSTY